MVGSLEAAHPLESLALRLGVAYQGVAWHACLAADHGLTYLEAFLEACLGDQAGPLVACSFHLGPSCEVVEGHQGSHPKQ